METRDVIEDRVEQYGRGPWEDEPDWARWGDDKTGYVCLVRRMPSLGHLCGYVGIPEDHPLHGVDYGQCALAARGQGCDDPDQEYSFCEHEPVHLTEVHGGLTFASNYPDESEKDGVEWWFGFDCTHLGDLSPAMDHVTRGTYRRFDYVRDQTNQLARQLYNLDLDL